MKEPIALAYRILLTCIYLPVDIPVQTNQQVPPKPEPCLSLSLSNQAACCSVENWKVIETRNDYQTEKETTMSRPHNGRGRNGNLGVIMIFLVIICLFAGCPRNGGATEMRSTVETTIAID